MYHPTTRVLTVLELLQSHPAISGPELARRLEVSERSVRRYVAMLQDMGVPVEAERGRHGAYRLRPGFKLPPLMFTEDEALALVVGLLLARRQVTPLDVTGVEGALAKVERVMPERVRERVRAVQEVLVLPMGTHYAPPASGVVLTLSEAAQQTRAVRLRHRTAAGAETERVLEPYGVVCYAGRWFVAGHCRLRGELRTFRLDRVLGVDVLDELFAVLPGFNIVQAVEQALAATPGIYRVEVLLRTTLDEARQCVSPAVATLEAHPDGVLLRCNAQRLEWVAQHLAGLDCPVVVISPPELRDAFRNLAQRAVAMAEQCLPADGTLGV